MQRKELEDKLRLLKENLSAAGFFAQQGEVTQAAIFEAVNTSLFPNCFDNNQDAQYVVTNIPPPPNAINLPPLPIETASPRFRLRQDEAIILLGKTPPECKYFSITPYLYERYFEENVKYEEVFDSLHDPLNNTVIKTSKPGSPFRASTVIVMTSDKGTWKRVKACLEGAGFDDTLINKSVVPSHILRMGLDFEDDVFMCLFRFYGSKEPDGLKTYWGDVGQQMSVLRVTPQTPVPEEELSPLPMPELRVRGTGQTEMELMPVMEKLRAAILETFTGNDPDNPYKGWKATEYTTDQWLEEGLQAIQANKNMFGENRDVAYMCTRPFTMYDNEFIVIYGVDHTRTQKAAYCSTAVYGLTYYNGVAGSNSISYGTWPDSAKKYLEDEPAADKFFVQTACRESHLPPLKNPSFTVPTAIDTSGVQKFKPLFVGFRNYLEQATKSGPIPEELISPRVIKFSKPAYPFVKPMLV